MSACAPLYSFLFLAPLYRRLYYLPTLSMLFPIPTLSPVLTPRGVKSLSLSPVELIGSKRYCIATPLRGSD